MDCHVFAAHRAHADSFRPISIIFITSLAPITHVAILNFGPKGIHIIDSSYLRQLLFPDSPEETEGFDGEPDVPEPVVANFSIRQFLLDLNHPPLSDEDQPQSPDAAASSSEEQPADSTTAPDRFQLLRRRFSNR